MIPRTYITYPELFDQRATMNDLLALLKTVPLHHAAFRLSYLSLTLRYAIEKDGRKTEGQVQRQLVISHLDEKTRTLLDNRFPRTDCAKRPVFFAQSILAILRLVIAHCDPETQPVDDEDERVRFTVGLACLMMNQLLMTEDEERALKTGLDDETRVEAMVQALPGFELMNPPDDRHLIRRLCVMYRVLLKDESVIAMLGAKHPNFDFVREFKRLVGIELEQWLFLILSIYAHVSEGSSIFDYKPENTLIAPSKFRGQSGLTQEELDVVFGIISMTISDFRTKFSKENSTDPRFDFVSFRSCPFLTLSNGSLLTLDSAFIIEKGHTGVHWAMHDRLIGSRRKALFGVWGQIFEEYVHWLLRGMKTNLPIAYIPSPKWKDSGDESFDGILLKGGVFMPAEYKGGFVARDARYSGNSKSFLDELTTKFPGFNQLADKIGQLFAESESERRELQDLTADAINSVRSVVPVLVLQDHIFRVPLLNWYLNRLFQTRLAQYKLRPGVLVRPLSVVCIEELESMVYSAEADDFDFVHALHDRAREDKEMISDLRGYLVTLQNFGFKSSSRIDKELDKMYDELLSYLS